MPFGRKADARDASLSARVQAAAGARRIESAEDQALAAELRDYRPRPELHLATSPAGEEVWRQLVREREWWRRTSLCERVGHCKQTPITFLPMPGDVRVCVQTPRQLGPRDATSSILLEYGTWFEKDELAFVQRCLTRDARCVDIGANHGVYCLNMAKSACEGGVWAFEPASRTADLLETAKNANGLDSLHVCRAAVSDEPGTAEFVLEGSGSEYNHLVMDGSDQGKNTELVQLTTLDECIQQFSWTRMDFIKIDAEGAELHVIRGGKTFFSTFSPLVMFEAEHAGVDAAQPIVEALAAIGYKTYCLVPALGVLVPVHQLTDSDNNCLYLNLFGCKDDTAIRLAGRGLLVLETSLVTARSSSDLKGSGFWDLPYVQALHERWQETASDPARNQLETAIANFYASRDRSRSIPERYAALQDSYEALLGLCRQDACRLRAASLQRVASELFIRIPFEVRMLVASLGARLLSQGCLQCLRHHWSDRNNASEAILAILADLVAEPFIAPGERYDRQQPPSEGFNDHDPLHTWTIRSYLEASTALCPSLLFQPVAVIKDNMFQMAAAIDGGAFSEQLVRRKQVVAIFDSTPLDKPIFLHSRAGPKLVAWLRRCVCREQESTPELETRLLVILSACCDPPQTEL